MSRCMCMVRPFCEDHDGSLADDPQACARMLEHFKFLFGDMGREADALLLGNMAELIVAAEGEQG